MLAEPEDVSGDLVLPQLAPDPVAHLAVRQPSSAALPAQERTHNLSVVRIGQPDDNSDGHGGVCCQTLLDLERVDVLATWVVASSH